MANKIALGSRPKNEFEKKMVALVTIKTGKDKALLTLTEEGKKFANGTTQLKVNLKDLPKVPKIPQDMKEPKEYRVRMNADGDAVEAITPVRGHFQAKLVDLGPRPEKDADPMPKEKVFDEGGPKEERHLEFFAVYEIQSGPFKGVQLPAYWMHYKFEPSTDPEREGLTQFAGSFENKKSTRLFQLRDWGLAHGLWEEDIPWDDETILPTLLERALDNDREVEVNLSGGYILREGGIMPSDGYNEDNFGSADEEESVDDDDLDDEDEVDKAFPPKKSTPKEEPKKKPAPAVVKKINKKKDVDPDDDL